MIEEDDDMANTFKVVNSLPCGEIVEETYFKTRLAADKYAKEAQEMVDSNEFEVVEVEEMEYNDEEYNRAVELALVGKSVKRRKGKSKPAWVFHDQEKGTYEAMCCEVEVSKNTEKCPECGGALNMEGYKEGA